MRPVHLTVVAGEDDDGVLPEVEAVERAEHAPELVIDEAHAVDEIVAPLEPEVLEIVGHAAVVQVEEVL